MPIYPSSNYNNLMTQSQLAVDNVADFRERTIYDVVDDSTGETTLDFPSLTLYDFADDIVLGEGYVIANQSILDFLTSLLVGTTEAQINYFMKEKEIKIAHVISLAKSMAFEIRRLNKDGLATHNATVQNRSNAPEPVLPSSQSIRSHLNK